MPLKSTCYEKAVFTREPQFFLKKPSINAPLIDACISSPKLSLCRYSSFTRAVQREWCVDGLRPISDVYCPSISFLASITRRLAILDAMIPACGSLDLPTRSLLNSATSPELSCANLEQGTTLTIDHLTDIPHSMEPVGMVCAGKLEHELKSYEIRDVAT